MGTGADPGRGELVHRAFRLELLTAGWMGIEAVVSIGSGIVAGSLSLIAFGADSVIELASALVLLWRLRIELEQGAEFSAIIERRAGRIAGALLFVLAAYIIASAAVGLWERRGQEFSLLGLAVTLLAIPMMVALSKAKIRIAEQIGSRALRADAFEAIACSYLAVIVVAGLIAQWLFGAWWIDSVTSLAIVGFLIKEGREAWQTRRSRTVRRPDLPRPPTRCRA
jgi:divalent metal cation (Fe/Co/Zn/Cd) transporter